MGQNTLVWIDNWLYDGSPKKLVGNHSLININLKVVDHFNQHNGFWDDDLLRLLFHHSEISIIKAIKPKIGYIDAYCWGETKNGVYFAKSGYEVMFRNVNKVRLAEEEALPSCF